MKLTSVSERVPYFLSKNSLDEKLQLLGLQTPGTKRLVAKTLSSHFSKLQHNYLYAQDKTVV